MSSRATPRSSKVLHYGVATASMFVGAVAILGFVVMMNEMAKGPDRRKLESGTAIEVRKVPPPKPQQVAEKPKPKPRRNPRVPPAPSLAVFTSGLSGIAFDIPELQVDDALGGGELLQAKDDVTHTSETVDEPPVAIQRTEVEYPPTLRQKGVEGYVMLGVLVAASAQIEQIKVLESKPPGVFDEAAIAAVRSWRFQAGRYKGEPVRTWARQPVRFQLSRR